MQHLMIDLETLGTRADAVILSIGAVKFDLDSDKIDDAAFYASISVDSNLASQRKISEDTLIWWLQQSPEAQAVFHEPKQSLEGALSDLIDWIGPDWSSKTRPHYVWSNGADFDIPMLAHAMQGFGWDVPWLFWNNRCVRTYKTLPGMKGIKTEPATVAHNALADAIAQVKLVQAIQKKLATIPHPMVKA